MITRRLTLHFSEVFDGATSALVSRLGCSSNLNVPFKSLSLISHIHGVGDSKDSDQSGSNVSESFSSNIMPQTLGSKLGFRRPIDSSGQKEFETGRNTSRSMNFVRDLMKGDRKDLMGDSPLTRFSVETNADIVHVKLMRNNTFVTVTDSKGNKKIGASSGCLSEMKGGRKPSRYAAEATAEHVGRVAKSLGLKSVVMKVNGFTHFKKKKQAILSFREGYTNSRGDQNPIVYIEDTTRKPHNGCRLRKKRRV